MSRLHARLAKLEVIGKQPDPPVLILRFVGAAAGRPTPLGRLLGLRELGGSVEIPRAAGESEEACIARVTEVGRLRAVESGGAVILEELRAS